MAERDTKKKKEKPVGIKDVRPLGRQADQVEWPGGRGKVGLLLLHCAEVQAAHFAAVQAFQDAGIPMDGASGETFLREIELQEVYRMALRPNARDPEARLFKSADEARQELMLDEVGWLQEQHAQGMGRSLVARGIISVDLTDEEPEDDAN